MGKKCLYNLGWATFDGVTIKIPDGVGILLHQPASHPTFSCWVLLKMNLVLLLDQLRLA